ncbi:hypothetical protein ASG35_02615 [Burkholderia sp. Leaf177]|nr:hypothetical protein ASG35_02615 [Burkholderia sp. Leaf177]
MWGHAKPGVLFGQYLIRETIMKNVSIGAWRERTRLGIGISIIAAGAGLQLLQWLHTSMPG